ncbi:MAG: HPr family phosphocarrier protein [Candidatus Zixiibacteriota bacterium]
MITRTVQVKNKFGLHARPAALIVTTASKYKSEFYLSKDGVRVNGKSIMGVMMLAAEMGSELILELDGSDEEKAMADIVGVIESRFGEGE